MSGTDTANFRPTTHDAELTKGEWQPVEATTMFGLPVERTEAALERAALDAGVPLDSLLKAAGGHFANHEPTPYNETLTPADLEALADDDEHL